MSKTVINANPANKKLDTEKKSKPGGSKKGGILGKIIAFAVLLAVIGAIFSVIYFNLFGVRDRYITPLLQNIPIVKNLLPADKNADANDPYATMTHEELVKQIQSMTDQLSTADQASKDAAAKNEMYVAEINRLKEIEAQQLQFKQEKADFDAMIAANDPNAYANFYASISPDNAEQLYSQAVGKVQYNKDMQKYVNDFSAMETGAAAQTLTQMMNTDMALVVSIIKSMTSETVGGIFSAMQPRDVARISRMLAPTPAPEMALPSPTPPPIAATATPIADTTAPENATQAEASAPPAATAPPVATAPADTAAPTMAPT